MTNADLPTVKDELETVSTAALIEQKKEILAKREKHLQQRLEGKERFLNQVKRGKRIHELILNNFGPIEPRFEYEKIPEYMELQKEELRDKFTQEYAQWDGAVVGMDRDIDDTQEQIARLKKELEELQNE